MSARKRSEIGMILKEYTKKINISIKENVKILNLELKNLSLRKEAKLSKIEDIIQRHIERDTQTIYKRALARLNINEFDEKSEQILNKSYLYAIELWERTLKRMDFNLTSFFEKLRKRKI